jgi:hypothetical protein
MENQELAKHLTGNKEFKGHEAGQSHARIQSQRPVHGVAEGVGADLEVGLGDQERLLDRFVEKGSTDVKDADPISHFQQAAGYYMGWAIVLCRQGRFRSDFDQIRLINSPLLQLVP